MQSKKKKSGVKRSSQSSTHRAGGGSSKIRLATTADLSEETLEAAILIVGVLAGPFPMMPIEEALQTCYDCLLEGVRQEDLPELGSLLIRLGESDSGVLQ